MKIIKQKAKAKALQNIENCQNCEYRKDGKNKQLCSWIQTLMTIKPNAKPETLVRGKIRPLLQKNGWVVNKITEDKMGDTGIPDLMVVKNDVVMLIEMKVPARIGKKGQELEQTEFRPKQTEFFDKIRTHTGEHLHCFMVRCTEDLKIYMGTHGLELTINVNKTLF